MSETRLSLARLGYIGITLTLCPYAALAQTATVAVPAPQTAPAVTSAQAVVTAPTAVTELGQASTGTSPGVTTDWVVQTLFAKNISLRSAALSIRQAGAAKQIQEGSFPYTFQADAGLTRSQTPALQRNSHNVLVSERDSVVIGSQLSKTFPSGTTATIRAEGQRYDSTSPAATMATASNGSAVGYQATVRATVNQPLLSGYGATVNEAGLRAAQISEVRSRKNYEKQASELLRDALNAYWELWYDGRAIEIQASALELASAQQRDADLRVTSGALSSAEALKFRSQVATLTESLLNAQANEKTQALELGRLLGSVDDAYELRASASEPEGVEFQPRSALLSKAVASSPAVADLKESLRLAEEKRRTAGDEYRSRLDLTAWAEATGLAAEHVKPAMTRLGGLDAVSVYGGITYQTTLDGKRLDGVRAQADYEVRIAQANLDAAIAQLKSQAAQLVVKAEQSRVSFEAASITLEIAKQQANNERQRFALGAATPLDIQVAEEALRQAQLRVVRARVDRVKSWLSLAHVTGDLLERLVASRAPAE